jgi:hypothetical protein
LRRGAEARSSGLNIGEKSSSIKTSFSLPLVAKVGVKKVPSAPIEKDESGYMNMCVVDLLDLLASKEELTP